MKRALIFVLLGLALADRSLARQDPVIYRCEKSGVVEFSDQPCQDDSDGGPRPEEQVHHSSGSISVISPPNDLDDIKEASRTWMDDYRERQIDKEAARRETQMARASLHRSTAKPVAPRSIVSPMIWPYRPLPYLYRRHGSDDTEIVTRQRPYSALSGRFPGTRRRESKPVDPYQD